ncbi:MAG: BTAD domain-containing putative transcriptional regulator, partial [Cyanobacteriota bacterium]
MSPTLQIRLLGEFCLSYDRQPIASINADRLQSLLAYLLLHRHAPQLRQQLAVQLWTDVTESESRANLRRRLHDLRRLLPDAEQFLVVSQKTIQWQPHAPFTLDVAEFEEAIAQAESAKQAGNLDKVRQYWEKAIALYTGELLPSCYGEWIVPKREKLQQQVMQGLAELVSLLAAQADYRAGIAYAQQLLQMDSLCESAYCSLMRLHAQEGDRARALQVYHQCMTVLREELGVDPSPTTCKLYQELLMMEESGASEELELDSHRTKHQDDLDASILLKGTTSPTTSESSLPLVGRKQEWITIRQWLNLDGNRPASKLLLLCGEPGIGKTRLLEEIAQVVRQAQGCVLWARGFEAEMLRPYGVWIDALRGIANESQLPPELEALLFSTVISKDSIADRSRLFDAVVKLIAQLAVDKSPVLLVLDDIQWLDEASVALLHYVTRLLQNSSILIACATRRRELTENSPVYKFVQAVGRENRIESLQLEPLSCQDTAKLAQAADSDITLDGERIFADSGGNPLFTLEVVRALSHPQTSYSSNLETLIQGRLHQLQDGARELIPWAAALGRSFNPTILAQVSASSLTQLLTTIEQLEHHGIIRPSTAVPGEMGYDFAHDIVRQVAYQQISPPRRQLIHLHIAQALNAIAQGAAPKAIAHSNPNLMGDVVYHASLGGDHQLTASAAVMAAEQSFRLFAYTEAAELAQRGMQHCQHLMEQPVRIRLHLQLLRAYVKAGISRECVSQVESEIQHLTH